MRSQSRQKSALSMAWMLLIFTVLVMGPQAHGEANTDAAIAPPEGSEVSPGSFDFLSHDMVTLRDERSVITIDPAARISAKDVVTTGEPSTRSSAPSLNNFEKIWKVEDPSTFPARMHAYLEITVVNAGGAQETWTCSATIVDPMHALTAGHCVYFHEDGSNRTINRWASKIRVIPAYHGGVAPFGETLAAELHTTGGWINDREWREDFAIVDLDRPIGALTGWHGWSWLVDTDATFTGFGYPGAQGYPGDQMYGHSGTFDSVGDRELIFNRASIPGQSGSGYYVGDSDSNGPVHGITHGTDDSHSYLVRITLAKSLYTRLVANADMQSGCDLWAVGAESNTHGWVAGKRTGGVSFTLLNYGNSACSGTKTATIVLSSTREPGPNPILVAAIDFDSALGVSRTKDVTLLGPNGIPLPCDLRPGRYYLSIVLGNSRPMHPDDTFLVDLTAPATVDLNVRTTPRTLPFTVDGKSYAGTTTLSVPYRSTHTIVAPETVPSTPGSRFLFSRWAEGGSRAQTRLVSCDMTMTALFQKQHQLTTAVVGPGQITPPSSWINEGQGVNLVARPAPGAALKGWAASGTGAGYSGCRLNASIRMTGPVREVATFGRDVGDADADGLSNWCDVCPLDNDPSERATTCSITERERTADLDRSGESRDVVDAADLNALASTFGTCPGSNGYRRRNNLDDDPTGCVAGGNDLLILVDAKADVVPPAKNVAPFGAALPMTASKLDLRVGETSTVAVQVRSEYAVADAPFILHYDPAVLEVVSVAPGGLIGRSGGDVVFFSHDDSEDGKVFVAVSKLSRQGLAGSGGLASITFKAVAAGSTSLTIDGAVLRSRTGQLVPTQTGRRTLTVH